MTLLVLAGAGAAGMLIFRLLDQRQVSTSVGTDTAEPERAMALPAKPSHAHRPPAVHAAVVGDPLAALPEGLVQDLRMFNDAQIRAEIESIGLSFPQVVLMEATCPALPCQVDVATDDVAALNRFVEAVSNRFQHYLRTDFRREQDGPVHAMFAIGLPHQTPLAHYDPVGSP